MMLHNFVPIVQKGLPTYIFESKLFAYKECNAIESNCLSV